MQKNNVTNKDYFNNLNLLLFSDSKNNTEVIEEKTSILESKNQNLSPLYASELTEYDKYTSDEYNEEICEHENKNEIRNEYESEYEIEEIDKFNNAKLEIQDIVVKQKYFIKNKVFLKHCKGEFDFDNCYTDNGVDRIKRIMDYISLLAEIVNTCHNKHLDQAFTILPGHENKITRLLTHEFSFYTRYTPLSVLEFEKLKDFIAGSSFRLSENTLLLLSSFPVLNQKNIVHNQVIYIQGGVNKKIEYLHKAALSSSDVTYESTINNPGPLKNRIVNYITSGNKSIFFSLNICVEIEQYAAFISLYKKLFSIIKKQKNYFIPYEISTILTSNTIIAKKDCIPGGKSSLAAADPLNAYPEKPIKIPNSMFKAIVDKLDFYFDCYNKLKIVLKKENTLLKIKNVPFGETNKIIISPPYTPTELPVGIKKIAQLHNDHINAQPSLRKKISEELQIDLRDNFYTWAERAADKLKFFHSPIVLKEFEKLKNRLENVSFSK